MKKITVLVMLLTLSTSAFATHAYRSMDCISTNHRLVYKGNYPIGGAFELLKNGSKAGVELFEADSDEDTTYRLEFLDSKIISEQESKALCNMAGDIEFDEQTSKSVVKVKVIKLTSAEEKNLNLKSGSILKMKCLQKFSMPVHCK